MSSIDTQVGGDHYRQGKIQPIEYIEANALGFLEGCVIKRATRHNRPGGKGRQDIEKAIHELQLLLELRYGDGHSETLAPKVTDWISAAECLPERGRLIELQPEGSSPYLTRLSAIESLAHSSRWRYAD